MSASSAAASAAAAAAASSGAYTAPARRGAGPNSFTNQVRERMRNSAVYMRREYRKGTGSVWYVAGIGVGVIFSVYKLSYSYILPWRRQRELGNSHVTIRIPFNDEHEEKYHLKSRDPLRARLDERGIQYKYPAEVLTAPQDMYERPTVAATIPSETAANPTNWTVLNLREFDPKKERDVFIRTLYMLRSPDPTATKPNSTDVRNRLKGDKMLSSFGEQIIHGMVKCKAISPTNNCVPDTDIMSEVTRKMLTAVGPMYMLRHPGHQTLPKRFSTQVEPKNLDLLCIGLGGGGAFVNWMNRVFPHFKIDLVEPDGALVKVCRNFFGFQERDGITLNVEDPTGYLRRRVLSDKKYQGVFIDLIDEQGNIPLNMCKLEPLTNIRESLNDRGIAVCNLPNHDERRMAAVIGNWRMAFDGRTVILLHCATSSNSILMTFNDAGEKGMPKFGFTSSVEDFRQLLRATMLNNERRFNFDFLAEINDKNYQQLLPGRKYTFRKPRSTTADSDLAVAGGAA
jgi:hypothetical protein